MKAAETVRFKDECALEIRSRMPGFTGGGTATSGSDDRLFMRGERDP